MAFGALPIVYVYGFASITDPQLTEDQRHAEVVQKIFFDSVVLGVVLGSFIVGGGTAIGLSAFIAVRWAIAVAAMTSVAVIAALWVLC